MSLIAYARQHNGHIHCGQIYQQANKRTIEVLTRENDQDVSWYIDLNEINQEGFARIYAQLNDVSAFQAVISRLSMTDITVFLQEQGVDKLSKLSRDDKLKLIASDPRLLYRVTGGLPFRRGYDWPSYSSLPCAKGTLYFTMVRDTTPYDFWRVTYFVEGTDSSIKHAQLDIRMDADQVEKLIPADATITDIQPRSLRISEMFPQIMLREPSIDLTTTRVRDMATHYGIPATITREDMIGKLTVNMRDSKLATSLNGKHLFFSFSAPIMLGQPLDDKQLLGIATSIQVLGSAKLANNRDTLYEAVVDSSVSRVDFVHFFKANPRVWAVVSDVSSLYA